MHLCANCGEKVNDECRFCPECGALQSGRRLNNKIKSKRIQHKKDTSILYKYKTIPFNQNMKKLDIKRTIRDPIIVGALIGLIIIIIALAKSFLM